jgi:hypothetical protein
MFVPLCVGRRFCSFCEFLSLSSAFDRLILRLLDYSLRVGHSCVTSALRVHVHRARIGVVNCCHYTSQWPGLCQKRLNVFDHLYFGPSVTWSVQVAALGYSVIEVSVPDVADGRLQFCDRSRIVVW